MRMLDLRYRRGCGPDPVVGVPLDRFLVILGIVSIDPFPDFLNRDSRYLVFRRRSVEFVQIRLPGRILVILIHLQFSKFLSPPLAKLDSYLIDGDSLVIK